MSQYHYPQAEPFNFCGLSEQNLDKAKVVVLPVPYSSTTYYNPNTKDGPRALLEASRHMELWDIELQQDIAAKVGFYTLESLSPSKKGPVEVMKQVEDVINQIFASGKFPLLLGGEHSLSIGSTKAAAKYHSNLSVLQFDAHSDLRDEFEGTPIHHGSAVHRIIDQGLPVTQVGIRSVSEEEADFIRKTNKKDIFYAPNYPLDEIINSLKENVYISFDLDGLDPSIMPATGTPEPGGMDWDQALTILKEVGKKRNVVGADILELSPIPGILAPDFLAAKLAYKLLGYIFCQDKG